MNCRLGREDVLRNCSRLYCSCDTDRADFWTVSGLPGSQLSPLAARCRKVRFYEPRLSVSLSFDIAEKQFVQRPVMDENRLQLFAALHSIRAELDDLVIAAEADCVTLDGAAHAVKGDVSALHLKS